jgi:hypothetical protein
MRARKIGRWVGCAVIGGVVVVGVAIGVSPANADLVWERSRPSAPAEKPGQPEWVPAPVAPSPAVDVAPAPAD